MEGGTGICNKSEITFLLNESVRPWLKYCHCFLASLRISAEKGFKSIWSSLETWEVWHIPFARERVISLSAINRGLKSFNSMQVKHQKLKLDSCLTKELLISICINPSSLEMCRRRHPIFKRCMGGCPLLMGIRLAWQQLLSWSHEDEWAERKDINDFIKDLKDQNIFSLPFPVPSQQATSHQLPETVLFCKHSYSRGWGSRSSLTHLGITRGLAGGWQGGSAWAGSTALCLPLPEPVLWTSQALCSEQLFSRYQNQVENWDVYTQPYLYFCLFLCIQKIICVWVHAYDFFLIVIKSIFLVFGMVFCSSKFREMLLIKRKANWRKEPSIEIS